MCNEMNGSRGGDLLPYVSLVVRTERPGKLLILLWIYKGTLIEDRRCGVKSKELVQAYIA